MQNIIISCIRTYIAVRNIAHRIVFINDRGVNIINKMKYWYSTSSI